MKPCRSRRSEHPRRRRRTPALVERAGALAIEVTRLEEAARELEARVTTRREDLERAHARRSTLVTTIEQSEARLDAGLRTFDELEIASAWPTKLRRPCARDSTSRRRAFARHDDRWKQYAARPAQLEIARATAESDLSHLATSCVESVQATLDEVAAEVAQLEADGLLASPRPVDDAPDRGGGEEDDTAAATADVVDQSSADAGKDDDP